MKNIILTACLLLGMTAQAQRHFTKTAQITFESDAPLEKIEAINNKGTSVIDVSTGAVQWSVLIKAFKFEKALMEEHFNENYMESTTFPKASFKGKITNLDEVVFSTEGEYTAQVQGKITIHGVEREINSIAIITVNSDGIDASAKFEVALADYDIKIPSVVAENINSVVQITVVANYQPLPNK